MKDLLVLDARSNRTGQPLIAAFGVVIPCAG